MNKVLLVGATVAAVALSGALAYQAMSVRYELCRMTDRSPSYCVFYSIR